MTETLIGEKPLTFSEAGERIHCSGRTIERAAERGEIGYIVIGKRRRILPSQLRAYVERRTHEATA